LIHSNLKIRSSYYYHLPKKIADNIIENGGDGLGEESKISEEVPIVISKESEMAKTWADVLKCGVIDKLLIRLGELQAEGSRRPERYEKFNWKKNESKQKSLDVEQLENTDSAASDTTNTATAATSTGTGEKKVLWQPGYGSGSTDTTKIEKETEAKLKLREEQTIQTISCLLSVLDIPLDIGLELPKEFWDDLLDCLESSPLLRVLMSAFFGNTVKVILDKPLIYKSFLRIVIVIAQQPKFAPLLGPHEGMYKSISELLVSMDELSEELLEEVEKAEEEADEKTNVTDKSKDDNSTNISKTEDEKDKLAATTSTDSKVSGSETSATTKINTNMNDLSTLSDEEFISRDWNVSDFHQATKLPNDRMICALIKIGLKETQSSLARFEAQKKALEDANKAINEDSAKKKSKKSKKTDNEEDDDADDDDNVAPKQRSNATNPLEALYEEKLGPELFKDMDLGGENGEFKKHHYASDIVSDMKAKVSKTRFKRLNREYKSLKRSLPLHFGSTIAVRIDKTRNFVAQAMIMAPHNTPYDSGCFLFDVYFPPEYPDNPMKVNLETTGNGTVRFNPNLYNTGKVCLSLLGTWRGGATGNENWTKNSTFWQVLVSIQSAILGSEFPYFNEPGIETQWGTEQGERQKRIASNGGYEYLRVGTVQYAMTAQIKNPPPGFEDVVRQHFLLKKKHVMNVVEGWIEEAKKSDTKGHKEALESAYSDLKDALATLGPSPADDLTLISGATASSSSINNESSLVDDKNNISTTENDKLINITSSNESSESLQKVEDSTKATDSSIGNLASASTATIAAVGASTESTNTSSASSGTIKPYASEIATLKDMFSNFPKGLLRYALETTLKEGKADVDSAIAWLLSGESEVYLTQHTELYQEE